MYLDKLKELLDKNNIKSASGFHDFLRSNGLFVNYHTANKYFKGTGKDLEMIGLIFKCFGYKLKSVNLMKLK
tara:strand:- start:618 stop:833 length:216 start_codon:yes stop_codon:yes gene_type:complete